MLRAEGKHFSSGHDMTGSNDAIGENADPEKAKDSRGLDWEERGLQAIFEWQTMICALTGTEVANASLYDGASATAEAVLMAMRITRRNRVVFEP